MQNNVILKQCYHLEVTKVIVPFTKIKLIKGKALRNNSMNETTAASVLLKLFISGNEWYHTFDAPSAWAELHFQM